MSTVRIADSTVLAAPAPAAVVWAAIRDPAAQASRHPFVTRITILAAPREAVERAGPVSSAEELLGRAS